MRGLISRNSIRWDSLSFCWLQRSGRTDSIYSFSSFSAAWWNPTLTHSYPHTHNWILSYTVFLFILLNFWLNFILKIRVYIFGNIVILSWFDISMTVYRNHRTCRRYFFLETFPGQTGRFFLLKIRWMDNNRIWKLKIMLSLTSIIL